MSKFRTFLNKQLEGNNISQNQFAKLIGATPTYVGQMVNGTKPPPDRELQIKIADELKLKDSDKNKFFNNVAKEKNDIPSDIYQMIKKNETKWNDIRMVIEREIK